MKRTHFLILLAIVVLSVIAIRNCYFRLWRATVTQDGARIEFARVYANASGELFIDLGNEQYAVRRSTIVVGFYDNTSALARFAPIVITKGGSLGLIDLRDAKAGGVDPQLPIGHRRIQFNSEERKLIHVVWN